MLLFLAFIGALALGWWLLKVHFKAFINSEKENK